VRIEHIDPEEPKGWYVGPWNSGLTVAVGYANEGINAPHLHRLITEFYMVARGWSDVRIERETVRLGPGDLLIVEPGEAHTFLASSPDYLHFVLHVPGLPPAEAKSDRIAVAPSRLT
jgi:mannose-6-phosphate isomerase-like protein (cupin superfamily)